MTDPAGTPSSRGWLGVAVVAWLVFVVAVGLHGVNLQEDGYLATLGWRVLEGQIPYRDFAYIRPPLPLAVPALLVATVPAHFVLVSRWYVAVQAGLILIVVETLLRRLEPSPGRRALYGLGALVLACTGGFPPAPWHTVDGVFYSTLAVGALIAAAERRSWLAAGAAGALASAAALSKQGFVLVLAAGLTFLVTGPGRAVGRRPWQGVLAYLGGAAAVGGPLLAYLTWHGALQAAVRSVLWDPREITREVLRESASDLLVGMHLPRPGGALVGLVVLLLVGLDLPRRLALGLGATLVAWLAVTFWSSRSVGAILWGFVIEPVYSLVWVGALALLARQIVGGGRRLPGLSPWMLGLAVCTLYGSAWSFVGIRSATFAFSLALPLVLGGLTLSPVAPGPPGARSSRRVAALWAVAGLTLVSIAGHLPTRLRYTAPFETEGLRGILANPDRVRSIDAVVAMVRRETGPREPVLSLVDFPALYVLAGRSNPTRVDWFLPQELTRAEARQTLADLTARPPRLVVLSSAAPGLGAHRLLRPILAHVFQHYERVLQSGELAVYRPRDAQSAR